MNSGNLKSHLSVLLKIFAVYIFLFSALSAGAQTPEAEFSKANVSYRSGDYVKSSAAYEQLIKSGYSSAALFYNLGNCYYKQGNIAKAIVNYERALKLNPQDEDILFNLKLANRNTVDKIEQLPTLFYQQWFENSISSYSSDTWVRFGITLYWFAVVFAAVYIFGNSIFLKKTGFFGTSALLLAGTLLLLAGRYQHNRLFNQKSAVIMDTSAYIKSSPDEKSTNLFMLHAGTKIDIVDELSGWKKIRIANGNIGWITESQLEII